MTGKEKCELLKAMRRRIAERNGILLPAVPECTFRGECRGFCPVCDAEARALESALLERLGAGECLSVRDTEVATLCGYVEES